MDADRFDEVVRSIFARIPRRTVIGLTFGGILGSFLGLGNGEAKRKKRKKKKKCRGGTKKCGGKCIPASDCCSDAECAGLRCCKGSCTTVQDCCIDADCRQGEICAKGQCVIGQGICPTGADGCSNTGLYTCRTGGQCECYETMAGETRCGGGAPGSCNECTTDAECDKYGTGAFCARDTGPACHCQTGVGFCELPCPRE